MESNNYEYFSGANVYVKIGNRNVLECAGISYSVTNAKQPIYSYNSIFYDAVLSGRENSTRPVCCKLCKNDFFYDLINSGGNGTIAIATQPYLILRLNLVKKEVETPKILN